MNNTEFQDVKVGQGVILSKGGEKYTVIVGEVLAEGADLYVIRSRGGATFLSTDGWTVE